MFHSNWFLVWSLSIHRRGVACVASQDSMQFDEVKAAEKSNTKVSLKGLEDQAGDANVDLGISDGLGSQGIAEYMSSCELSQDSVKALCLLPKAPNTRVLSWCILKNQVFPW